MIHWTILKWAAKSLRKAIVKVIVKVIYREVRVQVRTPVAVITNAVNRNPLLHQRLWPEVNS